VEMANEGFFKKLDLFMSENKKIETSVGGCSDKKI
jgi:hypothetical protein